MRHCSNWAQRGGREADGWPLTEGPLAVAAAILALQADDCDAEAAAISQCREFAGLADSFHTLFGVSIWWPVGLRWNEGFSERRHTALASASATAAATAHLSIVSRGETAMRGPQDGKPAGLVAQVDYRASPQDVGLATYLLRDARTCCRFISLMAHVRTHTFCKLQSRTSASYTASWRL